MTKKVGINGFGRIGRGVLRALAESGRDDVQIVAVNSLANAATSAHLLQYDSTHGRFAAPVKTDGENLVVGEQKIRYTRESEPEKIDWAAAGAELVLECTGIFASRKGALRHLSGGARRVLVSAPAKEADISVVFGVNHELLSADHQIVSAASCTTNCLAPVAKVLDDNFGIVRGWMSTVHAYTADQKLLDEQHKDLRRARSAAASVIPTKTGAAAAIGEILPSLRGKLDGVALRAPVANVSLLDLTCALSNPPANADAINDALAAAANTMPQGVMAMCAAPLVSSDFNHQIYSAIVDSQQTKMFGDWVKVFAWYDNEWGFANRMLDVAAAMGA